jgi:hypothetical protein
MRHLALLLIGILITGCGTAPKPPGTPAGTAPRAADDQVVRGVGNLRKLLALPVVVQPAGCDWPDVARDLDEAAVRFLRDWKGYELVRPADPIAAAALAGQIGAWQEKSATSRTPPVELRARLGAAAERAGTDGVLVVHAAPECPRGPEAGLLTLPARLAGSLDRTLSAGIYDAATGALVWQNQIRPTAWDPARYGAQPPPRFETRQAAEALFAPIENAIPAVLETAPPPRRSAMPTPAAVEVKPAREPTALTPDPLPPPSGTGQPLSPPAAEPGATPAPGLAPAPPTAPPTPTSESGTPDPAPAQESPSAAAAAAAAESLAPAAPVAPAAPAAPAATEQTTPVPSAAAGTGPGVPPAAPTTSPVTPPPSEAPPGAGAPLPNLPTPEGPAPLPPAGGGPPPTSPDAAPDAAPSAPSAPKAPIRT